MLNLFLYLYEACVVIGKMGWGFFALLAWRKGKVETSPFFLLPIASIHSLSSRKAKKISTTIFPPSKQS